MLKNYVLLSFLSFQLISISILQGENIVPPLKPLDEKNEHKIQENKEREVKDEFVETFHKAKIGSEVISYKAVAGTLPLKDENDKVKGGIFFVSYIKEGETKDRPITFCFNGGPGSSSIWLHVGAFGPKRVVLSSETNIAPPYEMVDNIYSLLDLTDLIFIDPISTGFSKASPGEDPKQFHSVDEDLQSITDFILQWTSKFARWDSPKYLAGESYGSTRAAALALKLHEENFYYLNGVALVSAVLNFQTIFDSSNGNDLPYILSLPSYTATAWYHQKLPPELLKNFTASLKEAEAFAQNEYAPALMKGDSLSEEERNLVAKRMSRLTGLSENYLIQSNLRVSVHSYCKELLREKNRTLGRFDSRVEGIDGSQIGCTIEFDPSLDAVAGPYNGGFNQYLIKDLNWKSPNQYKVLVNLYPWNWGKSRNGFLTVGDNLREAMSRNPNLKIFVANGAFDLATPYFATEYTFSHLNLAPALKENITLKYYDGGHMMYTQEASLKKLKEDLTEFYKKRIAAQP